MEILNFLVITRDAQASKGARFILYGKLFVALSFDVLHSICAAQEVEGHMYIKVYILAAKTIETGDICTLDANFYGGNT